jgi:hypothetical protein
MVLNVLATPLLFQTRPAARGDDKAPAKALPAELAKAIRDGNRKAVRAQQGAVWPRDVFFGPPVAEKLR